jgi:hypothetical protein
MKHSEARAGGSQAPRCTAVVGDSDVTEFLNLLRTWSGVTSCSITRHTAFIFRLVHQSRWNERLLRAMSLARNKN